MDNPRVRIGHCCPDAPNVDVHVDGDRILENVPFGTVSDYLELPAGTAEVKVTPAGGTDAVIEASLDLAEDATHTVLATGMLEDIEPTVFTDEPGDVPSGAAHVRFIHASPDAPGVDIRVRDGPALFERIRFRTASDYERVDADSYDLDVVPSGSDDVALAVDGITLQGGASYTIVAMGLAEDGSLDAALLEDSMAMQAADD